MNGNIRKKWINKIVVGWHEEGDKVARQAEIKLKMNQKKKKKMTSQPQRQPDRVQPIRELLVTSRVFMPLLHH